MTNSITIMMKKLTLLLMATITMFGTSIYASDQLEGFQYGNATAPTGEEWQSPMLLGYNKLQPRASFTSFATEEEANAFELDLSNLKEYKE